MRLSIVLSAHNKAHYLDVLLHQLRRSAPKAELVLVDDGSTDGTRAIMERYADRLLVTDDVWEVRANNAGLAAAGGDHIAIVQDDDLILAANWLAGCASIMDALGIDILGGRGTGGYGVRCRPEEVPVTRQWASAGAPPERLVNVIDGPVADGKSRLYLLNLTKTFVGDVGRSLRTHLTTCQMAVRSPWILSRRALDRLGPLDEDYAPLMYDDMDYCMRARAAGLTVAFTMIPQFGRFGGGSAHLYDDADGRRRLFADAARRNFSRLLDRHRHAFEPPERVHAVNLATVEFPLLAPAFAGPVDRLQDLLACAAAWRPVAG
ncbi:glycosyltransferase [Azospirillum sp. RWY-5-1]|uniref:Glycosyltransferase n=1 Tax=Azospirillum oleiclasticum TaxID=2735135 RepID=A0ABX2TI33_9PROT|nr:glycosyltransferase family 2 protein [Azospirillum oleiclasticum]NYZ15076.1 glycosyltransferase [Azospirillum oleiclasticum]NYZ22838.1 glycosyltransferase [Azospirillum oleiclasticum]